MNVAYGDHSQVATGKITATTLNVRSEPSTDSSRIGTITQGTTVGIYELDVNKKWHKIKLNNQWGYVHGDYVIITKIKESDNDLSINVVGKGNVTVNALNIRNEASTKGKRIGSLSKGTSVDIYETEVNQDWLKVKVNNQWGYIHGDYVTMMAANEPSENANVSIDKGKVKVSTLNVRSKASTDGKKIGSLTEGTNVDIYQTGVNQDWLKINMNNQWGYIHGDYVMLMQNQVSETVNGAVNKGIVMVRTLNVRGEPSTGGKKIGSLTEGTNVDIYETGVNQDWLKVNMDNQWGYIHGDYVKTVTDQTSEESIQTLNKGKVNTTLLNVRKAPLITSAKLGFLTNGTSVDIYETVNIDWYKIKINQDWGYIHKQFVTLIDDISLDNTVLKNKTVVIDPGHGGYDPGAIGFGLKEKDLTLSISLLLERKLKRAGANVIMTRNTDIFVPLSQRRAIGSIDTADVFLSLHINSSIVSGAHGTETYWNINHAANDSKRLAENIQLQLLTKLATRDRGIREGNFEIIKHTRNPSILVELGFLSNANEAQKMASEEYKEDSAQAIFEGLIRYFE